MTKLDNLFNQKSVKDLKTLQFSLGISAVAALIYQVAVTNILFYFFTQNTYSLSIVLSTFLLGLGIGSFLIYRFPQWKKKEVLIGLHVLTGIYAFLILKNLPSIISNLSFFSILAVSSVILLVPTICLGASFPLIVHLMKEKDILGLAYSVDLLGAVIGSLIAGFWLIPILGNAMAISFAALLSLIAGLILLRNPITKIGTLLLATTVFFVTLISSLELDLLTSITNNTESNNENIPHHGDVNSENPSSESNIFYSVGEVDFYRDVQFRKNSPYGEVMVKADELWINNRVQCGLDYDHDERGMVNTVFRILPTKDVTVANVGLGCGETAAQILHSFDEDLDVIEINPIVAEANKRLTNLLDNDRVNLIIEDGTLYFAESDKKYDLIFINIENPAVIHASNIYTTETFARIKNSLEPGGIFSLWVCSCGSDELRDVLANTLREHFDYVYKTTENVMVVSDRDLGWEEYASRTDSQEINTLDQKPLSRMYFRDCAHWFEVRDDHILNLDK